MDPDGPNQAFQLYVINWLNIFKNFKNKLIQSSFKFPQFQSHIGNHDFHCISLSHTCYLSTPGAWASCIINPSPHHNRTTIVDYLMTLKLHVWLITASGGSVNGSDMEVKIRTETKLVVNAESKLQVFMCTRCPSHLHLLSVIRDWSIAIRLVDFLPSSSLEPCVIPADNRNILTLICKTILLAAAIRASGQTTPDCY